MSDRTNEGVERTPDPASTPAGGSDPQIQGNRPAKDAVHATPGSVLGKDWTGQPGATDFLGLDQDPVQEQQGATHVAYAPTAAPATAPATSGPGPQIAMQSGASALDSGVESGVFFNLDDGSKSGKPLSKTGTGEGISRNDAKSALAGLDEEIDEALGHSTPPVEAAWSEREPVAAPRKRRGILTIAATLLVAAGGFFAYRSFFGGDEPTPPPPKRGTDVAAPTPVVPAPDENTVEGPLRTPGNAGRAVAGRGGARVPGTEEVPANANPDSNETPPDSWGAAATTPSTARTTPETGTQGSTDTTTARAWGSNPGTYEPEAGSGQDPAVGPGNTGEPLPNGAQTWGAKGYQPAASDVGGGEQNPYLAGVDQRSTQLQAEELFTSGEVNGLRIATPQDLQAVWPNETIPHELVPGERKVLTPAVGQVRVILTGDEIFEGQLYAVGQQTLWIQNELGRVALPGQRLKDVQRIDSTAGAPVLGSSGSEDLAGLERVRVTVLGGSFFGKVIARDADRTIVITDSGARLTLRESDVQSIGRTPEVVIKTP